MSTQHTREVFAAEWPRISPRDLARIRKDAARMRAEAIAELFRAVGRGIARLGRALVTLLTTPRPPRAAWRKPDRYGGRTGAHTDPRQRHLVPRAC